MQSASFSQVDRRHADSPTSVITAVVGFHCLPPEVALLIRKFIQRDIDKGVTISIVRLKIRGCFVARPLFYEAIGDRCAIPAL